MFPTFPCVLSAHPEILRPLTYHKPLRCRRFLWNPCVLRAVFSTNLLLPIVNPCCTQNYEHNMTWSSDYSSATALSSFRKCSMSITYRNKPEDLNSDAQYTFLWTFKLLRRFVFQSRSSKVYEMLLVAANHCISTCLYIRVNTCTDVHHTSPVACRYVCWYRGFIQLRVVEH